jgi:hypothetical protein
MGTSDAVPVQAQTKAPVVGAPITIETAVKFGLPPAVATTVRGGETLHFGDLTVDTALAQHSNADPRVPPLTAQLYDVEMGPLSPEELAAQNAVMARGTFSPDVITKGTIAFVFTLSKPTRSTHRASLHQPHPGPVRTRDGTRG